MTTAYSLPFAQAKAGVGEGLGVGEARIVGSRTGSGGRKSAHAASVLTTAATTTPATTFRNMVKDSNLQ
jgi:hypothetical protein